MFGVCVPPFPSPHIQCLGPEVSFKPTLVNSLHKTPYSWLLFQPQIEMQIPKPDQSLISTLDLWKSRSIAFCHRLYMRSKKFLLSTVEKLSEPFGRGSGIDTFEMLFHRNLLTFGEYSPIFESLWDSTGATSFKQLSDPKVCPKLGI